MASRCDFYSDEEYEYACQLEEDLYRECIEEEERKRAFFEEEYKKEMEDKKSI